MKSLRDVFMRRVVELGKTNERIVVLDCDMAKHNRLSLFEQAFPKRFFQVGISEQNAVGIASGLGKAGKIPIVSSFAAFICGRAWEQIRHSIVYNGCNVKIFATHAGLSAGEDGGSHQCLEDIALLMSLPEIEVFAPAFPMECEMICEHMMNSEKPAYIRVGRDELTYDVEVYGGIGSPIVFGNQRAQIAIVSTGEISQEMYKVVKMRDDVKLIHIGCLRPINSLEIMHHINTVEKVVVVEEHAKYGGLASILFMENLLQDKQVVTVNMDGRFGQTGTIEELREYYGLNCQAIIKRLQY